MSGADSFSLPRTSASCAKMVRRLMSTLAWKAIESGRWATEPSRRRPSRAEEASLRWVESKIYLAPIFIDQENDCFNASDWGFVAVRTVTFYNFRDTGNRIGRTA